MNLRTTKYILNITFLTIVVALIGASFLNAPGLVYVVMGFFVVFAIVFLGFWRCPECKKHLGKMTARSCKHCGHVIDI